MNKKGLMPHEVFETPEQRYYRKHMHDGELRDKAKRFFRKLFVNEKSLKDLSSLEAQLERKRKEAEILAKKKKYQAELEKYNKEQKRVRKIYNNFVHGGAKSVNEWRSFMSSLKEADSLSDIFKSKQPVKASDEPEVVVIETKSEEDGTKS